MSKGMKQKTAIVAAFMADKQILILDEPTTGLDPLMRDVFLELVREERQKGKTILMSTHIFEEVEEVCDAVSLIHNGRILRTAPVADLLHAQEKVFRIRFESPVGTDIVPLQEAQIFGISETELRVQIPARSIGALLTWLADMPVAAMHEERYRLEQSFQQILKEEGGARA
jgi:ABC-2 type transport system ATP-binding protein